jgi:hypothetical protein
MDNKIKVVTAPDIVFDQSFNILVISPANDLTKSLEDFVVSRLKSMNLYFYLGSENDLKWLLTIAKIADCVIIDLDNCNEQISPFIAYILSLPNTHYRTNNISIDWSILNKNRFYDFPEIKSF